MNPLYKTVSYGKLIDGMDVCKYAKQWVVTISAMEKDTAQELSKIHTKNLAQNIKI